MAIVRTFNFTSATIGGTQVTFRRGQVTYKTRDSGMSEWEASGVVPGNDPKMFQLLNGREIAEAEFETDRGLLSGNVFVVGYNPASSGGVLLTRVRFAGTGPLKGL